VQRRDFLEAALIGGAVLTLPGLVRRGLAPPRTATLPARAPVALVLPGRRCLDGRGNAYDVLPAANRVEVRGPDGALRGVLAGELAAPMALAAADDGRLYLVEWGASQVRVYDAARAPSGRFGGRGDAAVPLRAPRDVAVRGDVVAVADTINHRVALFDRSGRPRGQLGTPGTGPTELNGPGSVALAPDGSIHVADTGNSRVQVFGADGRLQRTYGRGALQRPRCVRLDAAGHAWVADPMARAVLVFDAAGRLVERDAPAAGAPVWLAVGPGDQVVVSLRS
jgi:hypothetical protein